MQAFRRTVLCTSPAPFFLLALSLFTTSAAAQDVPAPASQVAEADGDADEIVVTARKREERLQDVPISISAFTAEAIRDRNVQNAYDIANFTPNFQLTKNLGRRLDTPNIRGQFGPLIGGTAPNASFFVDGVYISGSIGSTSVANLERVEILRGPQSATFGRATFAGAVNYITRKPSDKFEGEANARAGEDGQVELGVWASGPVIEDKLYFFAGFNWDKWDGEWRNGLKAYDTVAGLSLTGYPSLGIDTPYGQNFTGGFRWDSNPQFPGDPPCLAGDGGNDAGCAPTVGDNTELGGTDTRIATLKLTWEATEALTFTGKYEHAEGKDDHFVYLFAPPGTEHNCFNRYGGGIVPPAGDPIDPLAGSNSGGWICGSLTDNGYVSKLNLPNFRRGVTNAPPGSGPVTSAPAPFLGQEETIDRYFASFTWAFNDYELLGRYAHNDGKSHYVRDLDRSYGLGPVATGLFEAYTRNEDLDDSAEIRLASPGDKRFRWQAGYYWYDYEQEQFQRNFNGFGDSYLEDGTGSQTVTNTALFGSIEFDLTEDLTFAFEGRYARDDVSRTTSLFDDDDDPLTPEVTLTAQDNFYSFSPRGTLSWNILDDNSLTGYLQVAEGNKPGGFNFAYFDGDADFDRIDPDDVIIQEEEAVTYEVGLKGSFFDGRLDANLAVFYIDWDNQAINVLRCIPDANEGIDCQENNVVENAGKSTVKGLELEMQWYPTEYQSYTLAYGYTDSTVDEYLDDEYAVLRCPLECFEVFQEVDSAGDPVFDNQGRPVPSEQLTPDAQSLRDQLANVAGNSAPRVPKHNIALSQVYQAPLSGDLEWYVRNDLLYESKRYSTTSNLNWAPEQWTWNGRIGLESDVWSVSFYIDNITNEKSPVQIQDFPLFDTSQNYVVDRRIRAEPLAPGGIVIAPGGEVNKNSFQLQPRRSRNAGLVASYRFGGA